jgi:hypothetical protein
MRGEMEREFVNLPRHRAYCRLVKEISGQQVVGKYELYPYPLGAEDSEPVWQARFQRIIERTRLQYCTLRSEVGKEIAARKEELTKPLKKPTRIRTEEVEDEPATKMSPAQQKKLESIHKVLGNDYNRFINDPSIQHKNNLARLLDKDVNAIDIKKQLDNWRDAGSPGNVSPFAELIKTLLG